MKNLTLAFFSILLLDLLFSACANPGNPTGGPKDTIPPTLLASNPTTGSTNFSGQELTLSFSEYVNADKLTQDLIITPKTDIRFKHIIKKNQLFIKFDEPFADSTTYSLNFFDGVTDITEKNPAVNLVLAFSTGSFIDSIKVSGNVSDLLSQESAEKYLVGLYPFSDSLDFLSQNPMYFTTTNDSGSFNLNYIKTGLYKIISFNDSNKNLLLDPEEEDHGFIADTLNLTGSFENLQIRTLIQNVKPLQLTNNRPVGNHHEIKFNKTVESYSISPDSIYSSLAGEKKDIIRLYNPNQFAYGDSIQLIVNASDSLLNHVQDTLKIVFLESKRKSKELSTSLSYDGTVLVDNPTYTFSFDKPISKYNPSKIVYKADTLFSYEPDSISSEWNFDRTELILTTYLNRDSVFSKFDLALKRDSAQAAANSETLPTDSITRGGSGRKNAVKKPKLEFAAAKGTFISVEGDTAKLQSVPILRTSRSTFGILKLKIETEQPSFTVQLLTPSGQLKYQVKNDKNPSFKVEPSNYKVRILIDTNQDGKWSFGNLLNNLEPERIYLFPDEIPIRENFIVEDYIISF